MLSIRTQDRMALLPYENVLQINIIDSKYSLQTKDGIFWKELGKYETKERALEVLDEIQDYTKLGKQQKYDNQGLIEESGDWVYEMPKE